MAKFEDFIKKTTETAETVAEKSIEFAKATGDKAKTLGKIVKLTADINGEKERIKKTNCALGKLYYETYKDNPEPEFEQCCTEIAVASEAIRIKLEQIDTLKAKLKEDAQKAKEKAVEAATVVKVKTVEAAEIVMEKAAEKAKEVAENFKEKIKDAEEDLPDVAEFTEESVVEVVSEEAVTEEDTAEEAAVEADVVSEEAPEATTDAGEPEQV